MKKLRVTVEGKAYEVLVEMLDETGVPVAHRPAAASAPIAAAPVSAPISRPAQAPAAKGPAGAGDVISPLAGKVVSIDVKVGQVVADGVQIATVEAMKMNTYIYAHQAGTVSAILVSPGDGVEEGGTLLRLT